MKIFEESLAPELILMLFEIYHEDKKMKWMWLITLYYFQIQVTHYSKQLCVFEDGSNKIKWW